MNTKSIALKARIKTEGEAVLSLQGRCMEPLLSEGDKAKVIPAVHYSKGYLYLFELPDGSLAVHRLVQKINKDVIMKGDRSRGFQRVSCQNILGVVSEIQLLDCELWRTMKLTLLKRLIISYVSKKSAKDKNFDENRINKLMHKICFRLLSDYSYSVRKHWKQSKVK